MAQRQITILFQGKRVGAHMPAPPFSSSSTAAAAAHADAVKPANDGVTTKDDRHSVGDAGKRLRDDEHTRGDEQLQQQPPIKKMKPLASETTPFEAGQRVEVRNDEEGFEGAWFAATIVAVLGDDMYMVKYKTLLTDDEERLLREKTSSRCIRPRPPRLRERPFQILDKVEAWYNDGWWEGEIATRVAADKNNKKWGVYFKSTDEEWVFSESDLRLRLNWVNGRWIRPSSKANNSTAGNYKISMNRRFHEADLTKRVICV